MFALADRAQGGPVPRAVVPRIQLEGPKISRNLTTLWYAKRVDERFKRCLGATDRGALERAIVPAL